jgi:hypothetical protein
VLSSSSKANASILPLGLGTVLRAIAAAATPPPILLLGRVRLVDGPRQGGNCPLLLNFAATVIIHLSEIAPFY